MDLALPCVGLARRGHYRCARHTAFDAETWNDAKRHGGERLWSDATDFGLRDGVAYPSSNRGESFGMLTVTRSLDPLSESEAATLAPYMANLSGEV